MPERYPTRKKPGDPTFCPKWSGVTGAPIAKGFKCPRCDGKVHNEDGNYYCPWCDDYVKKTPGTPARRPLR